MLVIKAQNKSQITNKSTQGNDISYSSILIKYLELFCLFRITNKCVIKIFRHAYEVAPLSLRQEQKRDFNETLH